MSNTAVITDPSKNNMDGTSEVRAHPPLTSIAGHFTGAEIRGGGVKVLVSQRWTCSNGVDPVID